jgi:cytochrome c biogenesis protein CcdA
MLGHSETLLRAIWLLLLYNFIFILPMITISIGMYFGMNVEKAEETRNKNLKVLHLIAGVIMVIMGLFLI